MLKSTNGDKILAVRSASSCLEVLSHAHLRRQIGQRSDVQKPLCLVFYKRFCSSTTFGEHDLHSWQMLSQVQIVKKYQSGYMFWYIAHARDGRWCFDLYRLDMVFAMHAPFGFSTEKRIDSFIYEQKLSCGNVDNRKHCRARVLRFQYRNCRQNIGFRKENTYRPHNFCPKPIGATPFYVQNRCVRRHGPIGP